MVLAVFDSSRPFEQEDLDLMEALEGVPCVAVVNKSDLDCVVDLKYINDHFQQMVFLSAKSGGVIGRPSASSCPGTAYCYD